MGDAGWWWYVCVWVGGGSVFCYECRMHFFVYSRYHDIPATTTTPGTTAGSGTIPGPTTG